MNFQAKVQVIAIYDPYVEKYLGYRGLVRQGGQFLSSPPLSPQRFHQDLNCCWVYSEQASNPWLEVCLEPWIFGKHSNRYATRPKLSGIIRYLERSSQFRDIFRLSEINMEDQFYAIKHFQQLEVCFLCHGKKIKFCSC